MARASYIPLTLLASAASAAFSAVPSQSGCEQRLLPGEAARPSAQRPVTALDLIELRDIGDPDGEQALAISPDGQRAAFAIKRADAHADSHCFGVMVVPLQGPPAAKLLDVGGETALIYSPFNHRASNFTGGYVSASTMKWSPDGHALAYLRRDGGSTQLWLTGSEISAHKVSHSQVDVIDFWWLPDGTGLILATDTGIAKSRDEIASEAHRGFRYDDRWRPMDRNEPVALDNDGPSFWYLAPGQQLMRPATPDEKRTVGIAVADGPPSPAISAEGPKDHHVWTQKVDPDSLVSLDRVWGRTSTGKITPCPDAHCAGRIDEPWWSSDQRAVYYLRHEGWTRGDTALYRWQPGATEAHRIMVTDALLGGCTMTRSELICSWEDSTHPRRLVGFDLKTGVRRMIFDPNPEFSDVRIGLVQRLKWTNAMGQQAFGDLVLPPDHRPGAKHPLIIVQYQSQGFLRGGTGDAYPIQLFAAHGYAVLSMQRPLRYNLGRPSKTYADLYRSEADGSDVRDVLSAIEEGVQRAVATGTVDETRIGITGLSDGASKARFALLHSKLFKAAEISSCCDDPNSESLIGPASSKDLLDGGLPPIGAYAPDYWADYSFLQDPTKFDTPLLIQTADREYLRAVPTVERLQELGKPVEMFVFPDEYHVLIHPQHRLAMYERDIDWFDVWLHDMDPDAPPGSTRAGDIARWITMREQWRAHMAQASLKATIPGPSIRHPIAAAAAGNTPSTAVSGQ